MSLQVSAPGLRPSWRSVAVPTEHGGWGLTLEPVLLGLLVAPSLAGVFVGLAAFVAFLARTPLKLALVDAHRDRQLARTTLARRVAAVELAVVIALVVAAALTANGPFWVPAVIALPLVALELWFDMRSRGRRLTPELAGAVGVNAVAAMIVLADGGPAGLAGAAWLILAARAVTSIPWVRNQVAILHSRPTSESARWDVAALVLAGLALVLERWAIAGALAIIAIVVYQRVAGRRTPPRAVVLGTRQMAIGLALVLVTAVGLLAA